MESVQPEFRYCRVLELKRLLFANNLGGEGTPGGSRQNLRTVQKTSGPLFLEVRGRLRQAAEQTRFGVRGNRGQGGQEKLIGGFLEGPAGAGTPLLGRLHVGAVRS